MLIEPGGEMRMMVVVVMIVMMINQQQWERDQARGILVYLRRISTSRSCQHGRRATLAHGLLSMNTP